MDDTKNRNLPLSQRGMSFETFMWVFTRLSALAIYILMIVGVIGILVVSAQHHMNFAQIFRWAFSPNPHHGHDSPMLTFTPWAARFWKIIAAGLLLISTAHGVHGLVVVADDYITSERGRKFVRFLSIVSIGFFSLVGLYVLWKS